MSFEQKTMNEKMKSSTLNNNLTPLPQLQQKAEHHKVTKPRDYDDNREKRTWNPSIGLYRLTASSKDFHCKAHAYST